MSLITLHFKSAILHKSTSLCAIVPEIIENLDSSNFQVLYLLHGMGDDFTKWMRRTNIEQYVRDTKLVVISADFGTSFYTKMKHGDDYWKFLTVELPTIVNKLFPISKRREDHFVAGMSMGGFGAFKWALNQPEKFASAGSFSGVLDLNEFFIKHDSNLLKKLHLTGGKNYLSEVYRNDFGKGPLTRTKNDLKWLIQTKAPKAMPELYQYCGQNDPLLKINKEFEGIAKKIPNLRYSFSSTPGGHEWNYWNKCIYNYLHQIPLKK